MDAHIFGIESMTFTLATILENPLIWIYRRCQGCGTEDLPLHNLLSD